ncbi:hypothetical protein [Algoriphagus boritolerans]|uniref:hypothetical protein n=1 Tax=Algoriphagus boritolerans TaxID=308111 RepID=UPI0011B01D44|nr:hypothetical protein [Algoriphagus boritolerans]
MKVILLKTPGTYFNQMEAIASFCILFIVYFLGCMAIVQLAIRPMKRMVRESDGLEKWKSNHFQILALSFFLSLITTTIAYLIFPLI